MAKHTTHSIPSTERLAHYPHDAHVDLPDIHNYDSFVEIVTKLHTYFVSAIDGPHTFEQLRTSSAGFALKPLVRYLSDRVYHPAIVSALLAVKGQFSALDPDDRGVNLARALACEITAWRFLASLQKIDVVEYLLYETPPPNDDDSDSSSDTERGPRSRLHPNGDQRARLLEPPSPLVRHHRRAASSVFGIHWAQDGSKADEQLALQFIGLNALEVAAVVNAKKFLSQNIVQIIINEIWRGDIIFWESLSVHTKKKAQFYNKKRADPFCRLRVPRYQKYFEVIFFASFLVLYYAVVVERAYDRITPLEILLYIWVAAFAYDEFSEFMDAGRYFYAADFWSVWDLGIITVGLVFLITRVTGIIRQSDAIVDVAFDILSLEALFLVPRICSVLSLNQYFGTLIPCLKEMTKDFVKFLGIVVILYVGFLTTFTLLGRDHFTLSKMSWLLVRVFFGAASLGFDEMYSISPVLGPPLMIVFVGMTNVLLLTSLISLLSNSLIKVMDHAREEYLFVYSVFVLEASTSNRLTYFYAPLNLIPLIFLRPLRLCLSADQLRRARISILKITHVGYLAAILAFEKIFEQKNRKSEQQSHSPASGPPSATTGTGKPRATSGGAAAAAAIFKHASGASRDTGSRDAAFIDAGQAPVSSSSAKSTSAAKDEMAATMGRLGAQMSELQRAMAGLEQQMMMMAANTTKSPDTCSSRRTDGQSQ